MTHSLIGLISFTVIFGGALIGLLTARYLPPEHLSSQTQTAVNVSVAVIGTLAALVLGLMITTASNSFSARSNEVTELSFQLIRIDRLLRRYGTEADEARARLRAWAAATTRELFPEPGQSPPSNSSTIDMLETMQDTILSLAPKDDKQTFLREQALTLSGNLFQARWLLQQQIGESFPMPFLVLLIFWLALVFASFGLFAPRNATAFVALVLCAMAVSGGIVFIAELDTPFLGLIHVSPDSMHQALAQIMP